MAVLSLTKADFQTKTKKGLSLIDFWAEWCMPCRMAGPVIDELAEAYKGKLLVGKVNVDEEPALAEQFAVMSVPTVVILKDGQEVDRTVGFVNRETYEQLIEKYLK